MKNPQKCVLRAKLFEKVYHLTSKVVLPLERKEMRLRGICDGMKDGECHNGRIVQYERNNRPLCITPNNKWDANSLFKGLFCRRSLVRARVFYVNYINYVYIANYNHKSKEHSITTVHSKGNHKSKKGSITVYTMYNSVLGSYTTYNYMQENKSVATEE